MANVANTNATGPASKDAVSGGKKFPLAQKESLGGGWTLGNTSDQAARAIKSLRIKSTGYSSNVESEMKNKKAPK